MEEEDEIAKGGRERSLLTMRGANTRFVQRIMRHSDPRMTERCTHLDPAYLHGEMDALMRFQPATAAPQSDERAALAATARAPSTRPPERESAPFVTRGSGGHFGAPRPPHDFRRNS